MKHIIIVEDDPAIKDSLLLIFDRLDIRVTSFQNGEMILSGDYDLPDLFLLDKQLSGVDGLDLCRYIKSQENTRAIPVIMMSANPHITTLAQTAGADGVINKPYKISDLRGMILQHLEAGSYTGK